MSSNTEFDYDFAASLMSVMVENSQKPDEGNMDFVEKVGSFLQSFGVNVREVSDPEYEDRALLVAEFGDRIGEQSLATISHSDVVGVDGQSWATNPFKLHENGGEWIGRGVCDTHGSGVGMIMAGMREDVSDALKTKGKKVSVIFTSDEEAPAEELSYRGAKLAAGLLGVESQITSDYFIAVEPTERDGVIKAMRAHKGRWLVGLNWTEEQVGHSAEDVKNAFTPAILLGAKLIEFAHGELRSGNRDDAVQIFSPSYSTIQITGAAVKDRDLSITPNSASIFLDLRTLPSEHELDVERVRSIIASSSPAPRIAIIDSFAGTLTPQDSLIVQAAEAAIGSLTIGFNGGDEGEIFRQVGKQGVTIGPGDLSNAHAPNEKLRVESLADSVEIYSTIYKKSADFL